MKAEIHLEEGAEVVRGRGIKEGEVGVDTEEAV